MVLATVTLGGLGLGLNHPDEPPSPGSGQWGAIRETGSVSPRGPALPRSLPAQLDIQSVGIHTGLMELGLNKDGTLEVPAEPMLAGWYAGSPTPGQRGPAVIAGHVDSRETGPAVFYRLGEVVRGDRVEITRKDGTVATFKVTAVRSYPQAAFPTTTVYGNTGRASLRLITCGDWDDDNKEYDGNVVVFAELVVPAT